MKLFTFLFAASIIFVGMACGADSPSTDSTEQTAPAAPAETTTDQSQFVQPAPDASAPAPVNVAPAASAPATTAAGMNPPHGQPGHRCDIAVGAPLPK